MKGAIMQPYFFPYIGYFQLISAVDEFIIYDNIKYTKKGWINRNRILVNGADELISLPLKKDSDSLNVVQRELAVDFNKRDLLNKIRGAYLKAPQFTQVFPLVEKIVLYERTNLFEYIFNSVRELCDFLSINTNIEISSKIEIDHTLRSEDKVIALCKKRGFQTYINPIGGIELYSTDAFKEKGIELKFIESKIRPYCQGGNEFISHLSIIDILMFNDKEIVIDQLADYSFVCRK